MFTKVFDSLTSGLSRLVLGWAVPSAVTVGIFVLFVFPHVEQVWPFKALGGAARTNAVTLVGVLGFVVVTLAVVVAYSDLPIYRFLEGYTIPRPLRKRLYRRELKRWLVLHRFKDHPGLPTTMKELRIESKLLYPEELEDLQATRLGNALRAMEVYGSQRFGLDTQTLWYELVACAPKEIRQDLQQTRAAVDIFVSTAANFAVLAVVSLSIGVWVLSWEPVAIGLGAVVVVRLAYNSAVRNMLDWRYATQALVHTARKPLAEQLGFALPMSASEEWTFWYNICAYVSAGDLRRFWGPLDRFRIPRESSSITQT